MPAPVSRAAFEEQLVAAAGRYPFEDTRLHHLLAAGRCPPAMLRRYARALHQGAVDFCGLLAALVEAAPDREARGVLLDNLMEEEGIVLRPGRGLERNPQQRHAAWAERFVLACGGGVEGAGAPAGGLATGHVGALLDEGRWLEAVSFLLVGQEMAFSSVSARLAALFGDLGFARRDLVFFEAHIHADRRHAREALDLVLDRAVTAGQQRACVAAAEAGARDWWLRHGGAPTGAGATAAAVP